MIIPKSAKGKKQNISLRPIVTGVEITAHDIIYGSGSIELYNDSLGIGDHLIVFKQPVHSLTLTATDATIASYGANYAIINVTVACAVNLVGSVYTDTRKVYSVNTIGLAPSVLHNIIKIEEAGMVNSGNAQDIAQRVYDYFQQRVVQELRMYAADIRSADTVLIDSLHQQQIRGGVEKIRIDLARGMIEDLEIVGITETVPKTEETT